MRSGFEHRENGEQLRARDLERGRLGYKASVKEEDAPPFQRDAIDPNYTLLDALALELWLEEDPPVGAELEFRRFLVEALYPQDVRARVTSRYEDESGTQIVRIDVIDPATQKTEEFEYTDQGEFRRQVIPGLYELRRKLKE